MYISNEEKHMSRIIHLDDGTAIKSDVIASFDDAICAPENLAKGFNSTNFWNFVESDMYLDLIGIYASTYIDACLDVLAKELI